MKRVLIIIGLLIAFAVSTLWGLGSLMTLLFFTESTWDVVYSAGSVLLLGTANYFLIGLFFNQLKRKK